MVLNLRRYGVLSFLVAFVALIVWHWQIELVSPHRKADSDALEQTQSDPQRGRLLYQNGQLASGEQVVGMLMGGTPLSAEQASCASCHRPSAMGSSEGDEIVPALRGDLLFQDLRLPTRKPPHTPVLRPAYSLETLRDAIRNGVASDGTSLGSMMPRYALSDEQIDDLVTYLRSLPMQADPGVDQAEIHFATILSNGVDPAMRTAILDVFAQFLNQKNSDSRHDSQRAEHAPWHKAWSMESYRKWKLHVWELQGSAKSWPAQLERYYAEQPVFAVLNGFVEGDWQPIHGFCEDRQIPCLFPTTDLPVLDKTGHFAFYLDRGMAGQAAALAERLLSMLEPGGEVLQVYRAEDARSERARGTLRASLEAFDLKIEDQELTGSELDRVLDGLPVSSDLVLWLGQSELGVIWPKLLDREFSGRIYLSTSLYGTEFESIPSDLRAQAYFLHPYAMPERMPVQLRRAQIWMHRSQIAAADFQRVQANAFFTLTETGIALKKIGGFWFRDYFMEGIEHAIDNTVFTSVYPRLSLAPGQRFVSMGLYLFRLVDKGAGKPEPEVDWAIQF